MGSFYTVTMFAGGGLGPLLHSSFGVTLSDTKLAGSTNPHCHPSAGSSLNVTFRNVNLFDVFRFVFFVEGGGGSE